MIRLRLIYRRIRLIFRRIRWFLFVIVLGYLVRSVGVEIEQEGVKNTGDLLELFGVAGGAAAWVFDAPHRGVVTAIFSHFNDWREPVELSELEEKAEAKYDAGLLEGDFDHEQYEKSLEELLKEGYLWTDKETDKDKKKVWWRGTLTSPP